MMCRIGRGDRGVCRVRRVIGGLLRVGIWTSRGRERRWCVLRGRRLGKEALWRVLVRVDMQTLGRRVRDLRLEAGAAA